MVDLPPLRQYWILAERSDRVSILVVVDLPPLPVSFEPTDQSNYSFNPCCGGSASSARVAGLAAVDDGGVSILVVVDLPPLRLPVICPATGQV